MKYLISVFLAILFFQSLPAQSVSVTFDPEHAGNNDYTFPVKEGTVAISNNQFVIAGIQIIQPEAWSISSDRNKLAFLQKREMLYLRSIDHKGRLLIEKGLEFFNPDDTTLDVYQFSDGRTVIRDNVANFTFFDPRGEEIFSVSNFAQSPDGERESRLSSDKAGKILVLYNPVIAFGSGTGSRAQLVSFGNETETFFRDNNREIKFLEVSDDGAFITLIATDGSNDQVLIFDRFGNELISFDADGMLTGAVISPGGEFLTTFRDARMQVIRVADGEVLGSASSRNNIIQASYFPDDGMLISLNGNLNNHRITNASITAVHVTRRQIASENVSMQLSKLVPGSIDLLRTGENRFRISGMNRDLLLDTRF